MAFKIYDPQKLQKRLEEMTGADFAQAEAEARQDGERTVDIMTSRTFFAALAARALDVPFPEVKNLPIKEYALLTGDVGSFLFGAAADPKDQLPASGENA